MAIGMDSCAAEFVIPLYSSTHRCDRVRDHVKRMFYRGASGIFNEGEQRVQFLNERGRLTAITFQVTRVTRPLASVLKMTKAGHHIILDSEGSYVVHKGVRNQNTDSWKKKSVFVMRPKLRGTRANEDVKRLGFARQGR